MYPKRKGESPLVEHNVIWSLQTSFIHNVRHIIKMIRPGKRQDYMSDNQEEKERHQTHI
jgi:hypothetical protein